MQTQRLLLVIDDEAVVREAIEDILETVGISVLAAENGQRGIDLFIQHQNEIGAILLDMKMPGLSGSETLRTLRDISPTIKVLISSGFNEDKIAHDLLDETVVDFLAKPYDLETLIRKVSTLLECSS